MTNDAGVPGAPRFDVVLRGYDRRQVDEHVDRLQRVLARMRSDLEIVRSQPLPAVQPGQRPDPNRPRPTPRPRPGAGPDTIGNFTDRMQSILAEAEAEAAEIRRNAHAAARAEVEGVRSQVADLIRQRDGVLGELTRMRSQLEGMLAAPTTQMQARVPQGARPQAPAPDQFRGPAHPHPQAAHPHAGQPHSAQPTSAQPTSAQPTSAQPTSAQPTSAQPPSAQPQPAQSQPAQPTAAQPGAAQSQAAGSQAAGSQPQVPRSGTPSAQPGAAVPPPAPVASATAGEPTRATPTTPSSSPASSPASAPPGPSAGKPGSDRTKASAAKSAATVSEKSAAAPSAAARPERAAGKAAHRLPTGAYPAVAESEPSSLRPRTEPQIEPADLFRPTSDGRKPETRGAGEPQKPAADTAGPEADRTAMVPSVPGRAAQPSKPGGAETTTVVGAVRPQDTTLIAHAPGPVSRSEKADGAAKGETKGEAANGSTRNGSPSRSA